MTLSQQHQSQVRSFIATTFDKRLKLALTNQQFASQAKAEQRRRAHTWLKHYGTLVYQQLSPRPPFDTAFPEILKMFAEESKFYKEFTKEIQDTKIHLCQTCKFKMRVPECLHNPNTKLKFGDGFGNDNIIECNAYIAETKKVA
jgi:DNA replication initiation complex subunit (GINS family)